MGLMLIDWCALALVVFIGLPHGALDAAISFSMISSSKRIARLAGLLLIYLLLAIAIFLIWYQLPAFSLLIFLLISIVHFGMADFNASPTKLKWPHIIAHGGAVAVWLPLIQKNEVTKLFSILTSGPTPILWDILLVFFLCWSIGVCLHTYETLRSKHYNIAFELIGLIFLAWYAPPLVTFAIYFCFIHSRRHFSFVWKQLQHMSSKKIMIGSAIILSCTSWLIGGGIYFFLNSKMMAGEAALQTVFIGLAALTVPHMILIDLIFRPHASRIKIKN